MTNVLVALRRTVRRHILAARKARFGSRPLHVCYALAMDGERTYADLVTISALCVRRVYPASRITVLTDDQSLQNVGHALKHLAEAGAQTRSIGKFNGNSRLRSRFVKTQVRSVVDGDVLYLDADTAAVREFDGLLECEAPLSAAIDRNRVNPRGGFPAWVVPDFDRLGWRHAALSQCGDRLLARLRRGARPGETMARELAPIRDHAQQSRGSAGLQLQHRLPGPQARDHARRVQRPCRRIAEIRQRGPHLSFAFRRRAGKRHVHRSVAGQVSGEWAHRLALDRGCRQTRPSLGRGVTPTAADPASSCRLVPSLA